MRDPQNAPEEHYCPTCKDSHYPGESHRTPERAVMESRTPRDIHEVQLNHESAGGHWFSPETKRFFASKIDSKLHTGPGGQYFASSEKPPGGQRAYTVRKVEKNGLDIQTHGEFMEHPTLGRARTAAKNAANTPPPEAQRAAAIFHDRRGE